MMEPDLTEKQRFCRGLVRIYLHNKFTCESSSGRRPDSEYFYRVFDCI